MLMAAEMAENSAAQTDALRARKVHRKLIQLTRDAMGLNGAHNKRQTPPQKQPKAPPMAAMLVAAKKKQNLPIPKHRKMQEAKIRDSKPQSMSKSSHRGPIEPPGSPKTTSTCTTSIGATEKRFR